MPKLGEHRMSTAAIGDVNRDCNQEAQEARNEDSI
jgi:hypothetical protein